MSSKIIEIINPSEIFLKKYWTKLDFNDYIIIPKKRHWSLDLDFNYNDDLFSYLNSDEYKNEDNKICDSKEYLFKMKKELWI